MHKAAESILVVLLAVGFYVGLPAVMIWGWVRWLKHKQPRTPFSILSLIGFALATASGLLAASSVLYAHAIGGFPFYDPLLLRIYRWGALAGGQPFQAPRRPLASWGAALSPVCGRRPQRGCVA